MDYPPGDVVLIIEPFIQAHNPNTSYHIMNCARIVDRIFEKNSVQGNDT